MTGIFVSHALMIVTLLYLILHFAKMNIQKSDRHKNLLQNQLDCLFAEIKKRKDADTIIMNAHYDLTTSMEQYDAKST